MRELVSVLIAAYNEQRRIAECLQSLLAQTYKPLELIIVDDGSTDQTASVVEGVPGVRLLRQTHQGKARAVNRGALEARGKILLFLDADMTFAPEYVERMVAPILDGRATGTSHLDEFVANPDNTWARCRQVETGLPPDRRLNVLAEERERGSKVYRAVGRDDFLSAGGFDDVGYFDDQTLWPKLGTLALWVEGAICYHYNPETLAEVFRSGTWGGRSSAACGGWPLLVRYVPVLSILRAARCTLRSRRWSMFPYRLAADTGFFWGLFVKLVRHDAVLGK